MNDASTSSPALSRLVALRKVAPALQRLAPAVAERLAMQLHFMPPRARLREEERGPRARTALPPARSRRIGSWAVLGRAARRRAAVDFLSARANAATRAAHCV